MDYIDEKRPTQNDSSSNNVVVVCNSNCVYSINGFCQKKGSVLMLWTKESRTNVVICDDYRPC